MQREINIALSEAGVIVAQIWWLSVTRVRSGAFRWKRMLTKQVNHFKKMFLIQELPRQQAACIDCGASRRRSVCVRHSWNLSFSAIKLTVEVTELKRIVLYYLVLIRYSSCSNPTATEIASGRNFTRGNKFKFNVCRFKRNSVKNFGSFIYIKCFQLCKMHTGKYE